MASHPELQLVGFCLIVEPVNQSHKVANTVTTDSEGQNLRFWRSQFRAGQA